MASRTVPASRKRRYPFEEQANVNNRNITIQNNVQAIFTNGREEQRDGTEISCDYCSKERTVTDASCLRRGQHISLLGESLAMSGRSLYRHHAIIKEIISCSGNEIMLTLIHFQQRPDEKMKINITTERYDVHENSLRVIEYTHPRYPPDQIVRRAEMVLNSYGEGTFENYNLLTCNCEHFATWCVVGKDVSFQVKSFREIFVNSINSLCGGKGKMVQFLWRLLFNSSDEIASALTSAEAIPFGILTTSVAAYLIYCIYFTWDLHKQYNRDKTICGRCYIQNLVKLWVKFVAYFGTSLFTSVVQRFVLPLLKPWPWFGIPLLGLLLVLYTAAIWIIQAIL